MADPVIASTSAGSDRPIMGCSVQIASPQPVKEPIASGHGMWALSSVQQVTG